MKPVSRWINGVLIGIFAILVAGAISGMMQGPKPEPPANCFNGRIVDQAADRAGTLHFEIRYVSPAEVAPTQDSVRVPLYPGVLVCSRFDPAASPLKRDSAGPPAILGAQ